MIQHPENHGLPIDTSSSEIERYVDGAREVYENTGILEGVVEEGRKPTYDELFFATRALGLRLAATDEALRLANQTLNDERIDSLTIQTALVDRIKKLEIESRTDPLTGLGNRLKLEETVTGLLQPYTPHGRRGDMQPAFEQVHSLLLLDVDHFKGVNDTYGHDVGDLVLTSVAEAVMGTIRDNDEAVRWGGEEIIIVVPRTTEDEAGILGEKLRKNISDLTFDVDPPLHVTASVGVARLEPAHDIAESIKPADTAMYAAKQAGRNRVILASQLYELPGGGTEA